MATEPRSPALAIADAFARAAGANHAGNAVCLLRLATLFTARAPLLEAWGLAKLADALDAWFGAAPVTDEAVRILVVKTLAEIIADLGPSAHIPILRHLREQSSRPAPESSVI